ncbi:hypothetical protein [Paenibacillus sp. OSY-SE]|uniref:hypothetical protein n=1 Tax=Paenibacillus sp. OSY-SE TaxID=1196323 RepID=UPI00030DB121|nr:hypothetical protein [Paenibacillus sp. OSY-SE]
MNPQDVMKFLAELESDLGKALGADANEYIEAIDKVISVIEMQYDVEFEAN